MKAGCEGKEGKAGRSIELPVLRAANKKEKHGIRHSRTSRWRAGVLVAVHILIAVHILQWWYMGRTVSPIEPSEAMYTLQQGAVNAGAIFFALAIIATLIFGRFVCGWACHVIALQDFCAWMLKKVGLTPRPFRSRLLIYVPLIAALYMFVWPTISRAITKPANEPLIPQFTNHLITTDFWATFPPLAVAIPFLFICGFLAVYFLGSKGFCTYGCPYGGFFAIADKYAPGKIRVTDACNQCGHCTATCTSNVKVHAEVKEHGMVVDPGCMKCMDCVSVCPNEALYFGFGKTSKSIEKSLPRTYSLTWPEEIFGAVVFIGSYFAVWNVYQLVPMLMAIGISIVTTFLALKTLKIIRSSNIAFYGRSLRSGGSLRTAGWAFLAFSAFWIGLTVHSGWIRYNESAGNRAFLSLGIPDELALAGADPRQWLSPSDRSHLQASLNYYRHAEWLGLFDNIDTMPKLGWAEYLDGNVERGLELLDRAASKQSGEGRALSLYYRGAILNRLSRADEALESLDEALAERSDLVVAYEERGEALWRLERRKEAVMAWSEGLERNPNLVLANYFLAGAGDALERPETAAIYERRADRMTPPDAYFYWMLGLRLENIGMAELAEKQFERAIRLNPGFRARRKPGQGD
jgi:polyferredoxin